MSAETVELEGIGPLEARSLWPDEARDFTPWLRRNISQLASTLGVGIVIDGSETPVGRYRADLVGRNTTHDVSLVIENQLEASDQKHFGQLMLYAGVRDSRMLVWITRELRIEHRQALEQWNSDTQSKRLFGIELITCTGVDGEPVVQFDVVVAPSDWERTPSAIHARRLAEHLKPPRRTRIAPAPTAGRATSSYQELWDVTLQRVVEQGLGWDKGWRYQRSVLVKMPGLGRYTNFQFNWFRGVMLQCEFGAYPQAGKGAEVVQRVYERAVAMRPTLEEAYDGALLIKKPGENNNQGSSVYVARAAAAGDDISELADWLIDSGMRLRRAVALLNVPDLA
jgi:hypothetical protein